MSLAGLLTILDDDPQLHDVVSRADYDSVPERGSPAGTGLASTGLAGEDLAGGDLAGGDLAGEDLVAPPTLRPVLA
nr:hypothetical protein [Actinomycetota bacterium]